MVVIFWNGNFVNWKDSPFRMKGMFIWMFAVANTQNAAETFLCLGCFGLITKNNSLLCSISLCSKTQGICRNVYTPTMAKMLDKRKVWVGLYCVKKDSRFQKKKLTDH